MYKKQSQIIDILYFVKGNYSGVFTERSMNLKNKKYLKLFAAASIAALCIGSFAGCSSDSSDSTSTESESSSDDSDSSSSSYSSEDSDSTSSGSSSSSLEDDSDSTSSTDSSENTY